MEGYGVPTFLNLTQNNVHFGEDEHILIPIDIYTQSDFFGIGTFTYYIRFNLYINGESFLFYTYVSVDVEPGKFMQQ